MEELNRQKQVAPYSVLVLILGILSILLGCLLVGLACGIIGLIFANKGLKVYNQHPELYTGNGMLNAGKITSIIGIIFGGIYLIYFIIVTLILGGTAFGLETIESFMEY